MEHTPAREFIPVRIAIMTVSDSRTEVSDTSGKALVERLARAGHLLAEKCIAPDNISTGDELIEPGQPLAFGQIYNSSRYLLNALREAQGCKVVDLGGIADSLEATRAALSTAAAMTDLVITSGGDPLGGLIAEKFPRQGSDALSSVAWADGLVEIAENANVHPGDTLRSLPFSEGAR